MKNFITKKFLKTYTIVFFMLFFIDWILGVLRFHTKIAKSILEITNFPFGAIIIRLEEHALSRYPMKHLYNDEFFGIFAFFAFVFVQALFYTLIFFGGKILWKKLEYSQNRFSSKIT